VPAGRGPFPVLVYAHGHIDPDIYVNGQGLRREQDYMARRGYVVLHTDYRNHAQSSDDPSAETGLRLGYTEDTINAVLAVKASKLRYIDPDRIGLLGRSMGGGVALNVAVIRPDLVKAIVLFAPVSSNYVDNFNRWIRGNADRRALASRIERAYGSPEDNPEFWRNISPVNFFDRIAVPIMIHQGSNDERVNRAWTDRTVAALRAAGKTVIYHVYEGEHHEFGPQWPLSMSRTRPFFDRYV
jgi:dipeptidyl aminopeptidase/acylaminoacyl peptidase